MCEQLNIVTEFGYKYATVAKNLNYVWYQNCENKELSEIKFITKYEFFKKDAFLNGLNLYLPIYLSQALNATMKFIQSRFILKVSSSLGN